MVRREDAADDERRAAWDGARRDTEGLLPRSLEWKVIRLKEVDSTNAVAMRMAEAGAPEGTCVVAETQTGGRGRMGRVWHSPRGGLWFSVVLRPTVPPKDLGKLSLVAGVAVTETVREAAGLPAMMKWPNDVVVNGKKVSGTLMEGRWRGERVGHVVVGIGIDVAVDVTDLPQDVRALAGTLVPPFDPSAAALREEILDLALEKLGFLYGRFLSGGFLEILERVRVYSDTLGREIEAACSGGVVRGTAVDIDADGALVIRTSSGDLRVVSGDVSVRATGAGSPAGAGSQGS
ncbi:MAG: biotin--[acetyl-CoA-carboxylase] ligase [Firmicutes bacterium]|jgi:BirA family biotin operon repressor/biotin-[acetyl-CoA-carboxylase] ligase|nr:biotin--[acetyl-CoA-carboxylase] ligase [Bacillota bacterium]MDH7495321.1 biotin--[acetyl-CoA-carboxylase] ligase [Bacillota bacterium]